MYIKPLSEAMHERLLGRGVIKPSLVRQQRIAQYISRFFPEGVADASVPLDLPLPDWVPTQPELDTQVLTAAMPYIEPVIAWSKVDRLPEEPGNWQCPIGWSVWSEGAWVPVEQPPRDCYMLDIETVPVEWYPFSKTSPEATLWAPVCAVAISMSALYVWKADPLSESADLDLMYPGVDGISIGHNIGYDNSYSYRFHVSHLDDWGARPMSVDTMQLWMTTRGHCNQQRSLVNRDPDEWSPMWTSETTAASLSSIYEFYFNEPLDKGVRDNIVSDGWGYVRSHFEDVLKYCYLDVVSTAQVFQAVFQEWCEANTYSGEVQWLTLWAAMLTSQTWCPMDGELLGNYFNNAERHYQDIKNSLSQDLLSQALVVMEQMKGVTEGETEREIQLLECLDWTPAKSGKSKWLPKWYRELVKNPSIGVKAAPIVLGFTWRGELLWYSSTEGYYTKSERVANPDKRGKPVHSMLMKGFKGDARLGAIDDSASAVLAKVHSTLNWVSLRKRVASIHAYDIEGYPVFIDKLGGGTVTRRLTSSVTQVLPKMDKEGCVGSNVRALFKAPEGMLFVAADFDSQELLLAAELGDAILSAYREVGFRGSTPFSVSCHIGQKDDKTTPHWLLATSANIDYTLAKNIGYAIIYGQSEKGSTDYFLMSNKSMSVAEATERSRTTHAKQKGVKSNGFYLNGAASPTYNNLNTLVASPDPRSLLSHQRMSKPLANAKGDFVTTKQNWFIQEAGSSMRERLVVYNWYFMLQLGIVGRFVMTVHDEALYCVKEQYATQMAYCMQLSHLYITAWKTLRLNLDCLPAGQSYFSSVDIDTRWRKSVYSNPPSTPDMPDTVWGNGLSLTPAMLISRL